jgi:hypothetical protein
MPKSACREDALGRAVALKGVPQPPGGCYDCGIDVKAARLPGRKA